MAVTGEFRSPSIFAGSIVLAYSLGLILIMAYQMAIINIKTHFRKTHIRHIFVSWNIFVFFTTHFSTQIGDLLWTTSEEAVDQHMPASSTMISK